MSTVALIDDHPIVRSAARMILEREGYAVVGEAGDGVTGLSLAREHQPKLVLLDLDIPGLGGLELITRLRALQPAPRVRVLSRRWPLRRAISRLQGYFAAGGFSMHPDKTQLGRTASGFDWLGAWFTPRGLSIAPRALQNHRDRRARLYEQAIARGLGRTEALERVRVYERRWRVWASGPVADAGVTI